ncbi:MAG: hypothetical protein JNG88_01685 [Phycisphaerales bacterium]|nr:hypothetical protein [Phycisphaerales bacterium]
MFAMSVAVNESFGWCWILVGFLVGGWLGLSFNKPDWLGGYASYPRRLVRLGHISFIGLGLLNILFALSAARCNLEPQQLQIAAIAMIVGAIGMPLACGLTAWRAAFKPLFYIPVASLLTGVGLIAYGMVRG